MTLAVNKVDRLSRAEQVVALASAAELLTGADVFAISARSGDGVAALVEHLESLMPDGPFMFGEDAVSTSRWRSCLPS